MAIQARIPSALAAIHNFIRIHDPTELDTTSTFNTADNTHGTCVAVQAEHLSQGPTSRREAEVAEKLRDKISKQMWKSYKRVLRERGLM